MPGSDQDLVDALRSGDEGAFTAIVSDWSRPMLMLARGFVSTDASAEEVVQEIWLAVLKGLHRFEGRSRLRTWVYRILVNTAKTRGVQENRSLPWSTVSGEDDGPAVDPELFQSRGDPHPGGWRAPPTPWRQDLEAAVLAGEVRAELRAALDALPDRQRTVITLRDVLGHSSEEVCDLLDVSPANQRVLLHRARTAVRASVAGYLEVS